MLTTYCYTVLSLQMRITRNISITIPLLCYAAILVGVIGRGVLYFSANNAQSLRKKGITTNEIRSNSKPTLGSTGPLSLQRRVPYEMTLKEDVIPKINGKGARNLNILLLSNKDGIHNAPSFKSMHVSPTESCVFHQNRTLLFNSDVVIMKSELLLDDDDIPERASRHQLWVYFVWEAAKGNLISGNPNHNEQFNLTMTYSKQADIFYPYGECRRTHERRNEVASKINVILKSKNKFVAWFLSSCRSRSFREDYARALMEHIPVDVYGECGNRTCVKGVACDAFISTYKFFLAFENSLCGEYITEKLWSTYERDIVPVVFGALDAYKSVLPAHSYIAASDFSSPKDLANYLLLLDKNQTLYRRYFDWKYTHTCGPVSRDDKSKNVCQSLHNHISDKRDNFTLRDVWASESNKCVDANTYLTQLGVKVITGKGFHKEDVHIYDKQHTSGVS